MRAISSKTTISASGPRNDSGSSPEKNTHIAPFGHSSRRRDDTQRGRGSRPFDVAIFLASYILSTSARIFLAVSNTVLAAAAEHERHMIGEPRSNASAPPPRASSVGRISSLTGRSYRFVRAVSSLSPPLPFPLLRTNVISSGCWGRDDHGRSTWAKCSCSRLSSVCDELLATVIESVHGARSRRPLRRCHRGCLPGRNGAPSPSLRSGSARRGKFPAAGRPGSSLGLH